MRTIYVAATGQHVGKTTSTLGLVANLKDKGFNAGYCKPVGQEFLNVDGLIADKDAFLFSRFIGFDIHPEWHSPVVLARGATKKYIENPDDFEFESQILSADEDLKKQYDYVVYEGTGHPGVGSVVDLSNAKVARLLDAGVIMVVEGGIGKTIDRLSLSLSLFKEEKVPILGVIVNKVKVEKMDTIRYYLEKKLDKMGVPLLGILPYDKTLSFPIMATINQAIKGKVIMNPDKLNNRVEDIIAGSLVHIEEFNSFSNKLLVVSYRRLGEAIEKIKHISQIKNLQESPLSGIIVTGDGHHAHVYTESELDIPYFRDNKIPIITTALDTYGSVVKISRIEVKINSRTPWKVHRAIELIKEHVNFDLLIKKIDAQPFPQ